MQISLNSDRENHSVIQSYCHLNMNDRRHAKVNQLLEHLEVVSVIDLGCADGTLLSKVCNISRINLLIGIDIGEDEVNKACLSVQPSNLQWDIQYQRQKDQHIYIYKGDASKKYKLFKELEPMFISLVDVIEHLQDYVLQNVVENVFGYLRPKYCFISTPNAEFNKHFMFVEGQRRHPDHLFQWNRKQFQQFCQKIEEKYGYSFEINGIGEHVSDFSLGHVTQYSLFTSNSITEHSKQYNDSEQTQIPELRCHVINKFWLNNLDTIIRQFLYKVVYIINKITFQQALIKFRKEYVWQSLQKAGIFPTREFLIQYLTKNKEDFTWDENNFYRDFGPQSQSSQEQLQYDNSYDFQVQFGPNYNEDLSNSNTELIQKRRKEQQGD